MESKHSGKRPGTLLIAFYFHPEAYPPTLNAIQELSQIFEQVVVLYRNHDTPRWNYPGNVKMVPSGSHVTIDEQQAAGNLKKFRFFADFLKDLFRLTLAHRPETFLAYDSISLMAVHNLRRIGFRSVLTWYHNHDVFEKNTLRRYSISWLAQKVEKKAFTYLDIFSLPSEERKSFFALEKFKGRFFCIPNYPSRHFYSRFYSPRSLSDKLRILYQGRVTTNRGIEYILPLLQKPLAGKTLELGLLGPCDLTYRKTLDSLAAELGVSAQVRFDNIPYDQLPQVTKNYDIGLALLADNTIMHATIGTASNKIYEYAALGLPVIYHDSESMRKVLSGYKWAHASSLNTEELAAIVQAIAAQYSEESNAANADFVSFLNFEEVFKPVKEFLHKKLVGVAAVATLLYLIV